MKNPNQIGAGYSLFRHGVSVRPQYTEKPSVKGDIATGCWKVLPRWKPPISRFSYWVFITAKGLELTHSNSPPRAALSRRAEPGSILRKVRWWFATSPNIPISMAKATTVLFRDCFVVSVFDFLGSLTTRQLQPEAFKVSSQVRL
jgi:hypothetical protein